ncbi:MAG: class I SAM-dependent DNA methyltransferase, partial [Coriobacteriia bacterium]|nr:class I SAM-dependent DNA methyltransferase [Coriobacteriia bacterium]
DRGKEDEHDETFWNQFLQEVMGIDRVHHIIDYQKKVKIGNSWKRIDAYIPSSRVLIEQKSKGIDLTKKAKQSDGDELSPFEQAMRYAGYLPTSEQPNFIITSNFQEFRIYDRDKDPSGEEPVVIGLDELPQQLQVFNFIVDPVNRNIARQKQLNLEAAKLIGEVYERISKQYHDPDASRHDLAVLMVRVLFCLYAEDSGLFEEGLFYHYLREIPAGEGVFRDALIKLFKVLNTPEAERDAYLGETLSQFPYVNGGLFADEIEIPIFTNDIKYQMLQKAGYEFNWSEISPVIFGSIFESILSGDERRAGGMHYTSVENIHKVIDPLFLDDLRLEFQKAGNSKTKLRELQDKISSLSFLDPACGSGNFLTQTYLELRSLENEILARLMGEQMAMEFQEEGFPSFVKVNVGQFYGIEINDFAVSVANTALWIADHQANQLTAKLIDRPVVNLPLKDYRHIVCANALRFDWNEVLPAERCSYIMGNPPFIGSSNLNEEQKEERVSIFGKDAGVLDYVACWYRKSADYIKDTTIACAFVSTNSICQGQQVAPLWRPLLNDGIEIVFAHRTFNWSSEAADKAQVHVVIVGFSNAQQQRKLIFDKSGVSEASHINAYLAEAPSSFIDRRAKPICAVPEMIAGGKPTDGGNLVLSPEEMTSLLSKYPSLSMWVKPFSMGAEFINGKERHCLWFVGISPKELRELPFEVKERIAAVKAMRLASSKEATQKKAETPWLFDEVKLPDYGAYIALPAVSSERRVYIPIGFVNNGMIPGNKLFYLPHGGLYEFGIITSLFHNAWMRVVGGRLKSDYNYSNTIVYNNFVWPDVSVESRSTIESCAQGVLDARANHHDNSLADLYDPDYMPPDLLKAHKALDKAVEQAYGVNFNGDEEKIVAHLFRQYTEKTKGE